MDEFGIEANARYDYGWSLKGKRLSASKPGKKGGRVSFIAALNHRQLKAPFMFYGYSDQMLFETYVETCLVPTLKTGQMVVLDNASIHKSEKTRRLIEKAGCSLKFLPPYSPNLNPIEKCWFAVKHAIRKELSSLLSLDEAAEKILKQASEPI